MEQRTESWLSEAGGLRDLLSDRLLSQEEFASALQKFTSSYDSPLERLQVEIQQPDPFDAVLIEVGQQQDDPSSSETFELDAERRVGAKIYLWFRDGLESEDRRTVQERTKETVLAWWRGNERDEKAKILSTQFAPLQRALEQTVSSWSASGQPGLIFADIDHFKRVNDKLGEQEGDRLIAKLASALIRNAPNDALVIHRSGDEFLLLMPAVDPGLAVVRAARLRSKCEVEFLAGEGIQGEDEVGLSFGLAFVIGRENSFAEIEGRADRALKPRGVKRRGRVSLEEEPSSEEGGSHS